MSSRSLPSRIGRYEVVDRLGAGGMGVLYLARDPLLRRTLAIKVLAVDDDDLRERFAREARSAASLSHTNIVTIFDVGEDAGHPFLAMEYLDGETMAEMIRRKAPVPLQRRLQLLLELCAGLGYAHRLGIVHRDIKPANLMITGTGTLKILDFGLARLTHDKTSGLTQAGALLGTPNYMSPEQVEGHTVDHRSDVFSVGLVLYELLTYRKAYSGAGMHVVLHKITHERPQPLHELDPTIDPTLERIVARAIEREPERRYQSLELMSADATAFLKALAGRPDADATVIIRRGDLPEPRKPDSGSGSAPTPPTPRLPNFEGIARRREAQIQLHLDEASRHFTHGHYEQAIEQCELAAVLNPEEPRVLDLLSRSHGALESQQILEWLTEARARIAEGTLTRAEELIRKSLERRPGHPEAEALDREVQQARQETELEQRAASAVTAAKSAARAGDLEGAAALLDAFVPPHALVAAARADVQARIDARQRALAQASEAKNAARAAIGAGEWDAAESALEQASAAVPRDTELSILRRSLADARAQAEAAAREREEEARAAAERERLAREQAAREQAEREQAAREQAEREQAEREARERADLEREAREQAERERQRKEEEETRQRHAHEAAERARREAAEREAAERARRAAEEQARREQAAREQAAREQAEREQAAREQAEREQAAREQAEREQAEREARERTDRERQAREQAERERQRKEGEETRQRHAHEAAERARRDTAEREAAQRARRAAEEQARQEAERVAREQAERERADRLAAEKAGREADEREAAEKTRREAAAREAAEKARQKAAERDAAQKARREAEEKEARARADRERIAREAAEQAERERLAREEAARQDGARLAEQRAKEEAQPDERAARREPVPLVFTDDETRIALDPTRPMSMALEAARQEALQRAAAEAARRTQSPSPAAPPQKAASPVSSPGAATAFPMRWVALIAVAGVVSALAVFLVLRRNTPQPTPPATTTASTPARAVTDILQEARRLAAEGHVDRAVQTAVSGYHDTHDQALVEFVEAARSTAAKSASDAAAEAASTDAATRAEYTDAAAKFQQAAALTSVDDAPRAVTLYTEAEHGYRAAVTASSNDPAVFVRRATDAYQKGAIDRAIDYALTARRLDPSHRAADSLIDLVRRDAARETARARAAAVTAGATGTDAFNQAEKWAKDAARATAPDELSAMVSANKDAVRLYRSAVTAAEAGRTERHSSAERHAAQARLLISQKRLDAAGAELAQATALEPRNPTAQAVAKELAEARLDARITALLDQARGADPRQAVSLLQQASALDPSRDDVKRELRRRTDEMNARPPAGSGASGAAKDPAEAAKAMRDADAAAIRQALDRYRSAWEALDVDAIRAVYPTVNAKTLRDSFKNVRSQPMTMRLQLPAFDAAGTSATILCHITSRIEVKAGSPINLDRDAVVHVDKTAGGWRIVRIDYR